MLNLVTYDQAPILESPSKEEIAAHIKRIKESGLGGFVVRHAHKPKLSYKTICDVAREFGFKGETKAAVPFEHEARVNEAVELLAAGHQLNGSWRDYGVTQLHADGDENDEMLSAISVRRGSFEMMVFERGPEIGDIDAVNLFDELEEDTRRLLLQGKVNPNRVLPNATVLSVNSGDSVVINPSKPHMAVTLQGPRLSESTFFQL